MAQNTRDKSLGSAVAKANYDHAGETALTGRIFTRREDNLDYSTTAPLHSASSIRNGHHLNTNLQAVADTRYL